MRPLKPLIFFVALALLSALASVSAQQRPPQTIDDLFNPRPSAPVPQQQQQPQQAQPRPGDVQQQDLPPPGSKETSKETKKTATKKKKDDQKQLDAKQEPGIRDIMAPAPEQKGTAARGKSKALPEVPVDQAPPDQKIANATAVFSGLDKITGRIYPFEVSVKETVQFGALRVTPQACYTRPPTEPQNTTGFVEVDEITLEGKIRRLFTGWMFASSPGLHAVEHSIYDVWLVDCKQTPPDVAKSG